jgi:hypothetical protein
LAVAAPTSNRFLSASWSVSWAVSWALADAARSAIVVKSRNANRYTLVSPQIVKVFASADDRLRV